MTEVNGVLVRHQNGGEERHIHLRMDAPVSEVEDAALSLVPKNNEVNEVHINE